MIKNFKCRETQKIFFQEESATKFPLEIQHRALRKLFTINRAKDLLELRSPAGNKLEKLKGDRAEQYSIRLGMPMM